MIRCSNSGARIIVCASLTIFSSAHATPANKVALAKHYDRFLTKKLDACVTCHLANPGDKAPTSLSEFPHNPFGHRLRLLGDDLRKAGKKADIPTRLQMIAKEDSDGDGVDNETELLLGHAPGDPHDKPSAKELADARAKRAEFAKFLAEYKWQPFEVVPRPLLPQFAFRISSRSVGISASLRHFAFRNAVDLFVAAEWTKHGLHPRPEASKEVLLRRVYLDLIGLSPTPEELLAFENDRSPDAYERVVDRLLRDPRYGERWGRHWMDVWRYSDWAGYGMQVRDSKPHIWRWRDWIVESLNADKSYDQMIREMLAADELYPEDTDRLRATGYLVRNYKLLSREAWMEDVVTHTSKAFLGLTMECAKCHDHRYDPISQREYYQFRALFETHNVRTDRVPGQPDLEKDGLPRVYDADLKVATYFYPRGDERAAIKDQPIAPGVPHFLGGPFKIEAVNLPRLAHAPDKRDFVIRETIAESERAIDTARKELEATKAEERELAELKLAVAQARHAAFLAVLRVEKLEDARHAAKSSPMSCSARQGARHGREDVCSCTAQRESNSQRSGAQEYNSCANDDDWKQAATDTVLAQRKQAALEAKLNLIAAQKALAALKTPGEVAKKKVADAETALKAAEAELSAPPNSNYKPRVGTDYPSTSSGRRLALAQWIANTQNPLTARVAMNHIWLRHFGAAIVPSVADFGRNGRAPSHPQLLDWLAAEFMSRNWSMKEMHRLLVTSATYRMDGKPDAANAALDPDNIYLWRMNSRRLEAEAVRDNVLHVAASLEAAMGGPEVDHNQGLVSRRRSIYLRIAAEKDTEFLKVFDSPSVNECYERKQSVVPQQALALANSSLVIEQSKSLARALTGKVGGDAAKFINEAFIRVLARRPTAEEVKVCGEFVAKGDPARARENLMMVLFNHNDFVTVR